MAIPTERPTRSPGAEQSELETRAVIPVTAAAPTLKKV